MVALFNAFKYYIIDHPKVIAYKPTSNKYDEAQLRHIVDKLPKELQSSEEDVKRIIDFVFVSSHLHKVYDDMYTNIKMHLCNLNLKGLNVAEYLIAGLNREFKVVHDKYQENIKHLSKGEYKLSSMLNFRAKSSKGENYLDARASLEGFTDSLNIVLNYLRFFLTQELKTDDANKNQFAAHIQKILQIASMGVVYKHSFDDIFYNDGFVNWDEQNQKVTFDYNNYNDLKLLRAGDMMFSERRMYVYAQATKNKLKGPLFNYNRGWRIKKAEINDGCITLQFGQGKTKGLDASMIEIQSSIDSYYEFLECTNVLPNFSNATINEALAVLVALQYIVMYIMEHCSFDVSMNTKEEFNPVPRKVLKTNLIGYITKLVNIRHDRVEKVINALTADWKTFNDIWTRPIYEAGNYYLLTLYPIQMSSSFNLIDHLIVAGGCSLEDRGKQFEKYLYNEINTKQNSYPVKCLKGGIYGDKENGPFEEIDVIVRLRDAIIIADAKCITYSVEPKDYRNAFDRLKEGCEQTNRKADFVIQHPEYFKELGEYGNKHVIKIVITNYPTFTGFQHDGVYIIDSQSFLAYIHGGNMTVRRFSLNNDDIIGIKKFYLNETEFCSNFEGYIQKNPMKKVLMQDIDIEEIPTLLGVEPWTFVAKSALFINNEEFNISNDK